MALNITVQFTVGDKTMMVSDQPKSIAKVIDRQTSGQLKAHFQKIIDDRFELTDAMAILQVFERDAASIEYLEKFIADNGEAEATARDAAAVLVMLAWAVVCRRD